MTPGQARVAFLGFFAVLAGVTANALFLQARPDAASRAVVERAWALPGAAERRSGEPAQAGRAAQGRPSSAGAKERQLHIARFAAVPGSIEGAPEEPRDEADRELVRAIQRELAQRGYGPLAADGAMGLTTRAAIMAFEHDQGLALTGIASEHTLKRILLGASGTGDAGRAGEVRSTQAEEVVRAVQQWLAALDYGRGRADGRLGPDTVAAIREFEQDKGIVPRGRVSAELVVRLKEAVAALRRPAAYR